MRKVWKFLIQVLSLLLICHNGSIVQDELSSSNRLSWMHIRLYWLLWQQELLLFFTLKRIDRTLETFSLLNKLLYTNTDLFRHVFYSVFPIGSNCNWTSSIACSEYLISEVLDSQDKLTCTAIFNSLQLLWKSLLLEGKITLNSLMCHSFVLNRLTQFAIYLAQRSIFLY